MVYVIYMVYKMILSLFIYIVILHMYLICYRFLLVIPPLKIWKKITEGFSVSAAIISVRAPWFILYFQVHYMRR